MRLRLHFLFCGMAVLAGGCPSNMGNNGGNNSSGAGAEFSGTWSGVLACVTTQTASGAGGTPINGTRPITLRFDADGAFESVTVFGFSGGPDQQATVGRVGQSETLTSESGEFDITRGVTVTTATYSEGVARITLSIDFDSVGGNLTQTGGGTQTIEAVITNGRLECSSQVDYDVDLVVGSVNVGTEEMQMCEGTLDPE